MNKKIVKTPLRISVRCSHCHQELDTIGANVHSLCTNCLKGTLEPINIY